MVEWYRCVLGLRVLVRVVDDGYALLAAGDTRLALLQRPDADQSSRRWSLGFEVADLESIQARLIEAGTEIVKIKEDPEGFRELVATDPDGNRIRLFVWSAGRSCQNRSENFSQTFTTVDAGCESPMTKS